MLKKNNKAVHLAIIVTTPFFIQTQTFDQLLYLKKRNFYITIITSPNIYNSYLKKFFNVKEIEIERRISIIKDLVALIKLIKELKKNKYDIVHSFTPKAGLITLLASSINRIKCKIHTFTGQIWANKKFFSFHFFRLLDKVIFNLSDQIFIDSKSQYQFLLKNRVIDKKKTTVFSSIAGINFKKFNISKYSKKKIELLKNKHSIKKSKINILYLGRLNEEKGIFDLIYAFKDLDIPDVQLTIAGPIDFVNLKNTKKFYNEIKTRRDSINYLGFQKKTEDILAISDVLCLPSYREGFATCIIQAFAMKKPVIASSIYGVKDTVVNNKTGLIFKVKDISDLKKKIKLLVKSKQIKKKIIDNSYSLVKDKYNCENINSSLLKKYESIIKKKNSYNRNKWILR